MDESFKVRADKVFGSLIQTLPSQSPSPWTLSDEEVERREWNRERGLSPDDREEIPCASSFDCFLSKEGKRNPRNPRNRRNDFEGDLEDHSDDDDDEEEEERGSGGSVNRSGEGEDYEGEIRSSIGLDSTLDHEDEEDQYDKVAVGSENVGDRLYMRDVTEYGPYLNSHNVLPDSFEEIKNVDRDPRANLLAARARLQEDDKEAAGGFDSLQAFDDDKPVVVCTQVKVTENGGNTKSILKRKENQIESKSKKRVRFDPACKDDQDKQLEQTHDFLMVTQSMESATVEEDVARVPDYIRNPSNYICYTFESVSDHDNESNLCAYKDFCNMVNRSSCVSSQLDCAPSLPKQVTFTPRKKVGDSTMSITSEVKPNHEEAFKESLQRGSVPVGIAAWEAEESEVCAMEEDDPDTSRVEKNGGSQKPNRQYRSKVRSDDSIS
ncbi:midasin-like protein [Tasmannia lanceolata]|uniref:midasin-like protein n=1 Tax=Tasmannia lanceolata TaxID=3420 RepID=UPI004063C20B